MDEIIKVGRYCVTIEVYDNDTGASLVSENFNASHAWLVKAELIKASQKLI